MIIFYCFNVLKKCKRPTISVPERAILPYSLLLGFELTNHVLGYLSGGSLEKDSVVQFKYSSADLSDKEKSIVSYLAGYVFSTFFRRLRFTKKNNQNTEIVQEYLVILAASKLSMRSKNYLGTDWKLWRLFV